MQRQESRTFMPKNNIFVSVMDVCAAETRVSDAHYNFICLGGLMNVGLLDNLARGRATELNRFVSHDR